MLIHMEWVNGPAGLWYICLPVFRLSERRKSGWWYGSTLWTYIHICTASVRKPLWCHAINAGLCPPWGWFEQFCREVPGFGPLPITAGPSWFRPVLVICTDQKNIWYTWFWRVWQPGLPAGGGPSVVSHGSGIVFGPFTELFPVHSWNNMCVSSKIRWTISIQSYKHLTTLDSEHILFQFSFPIKYEFYTENLLFSL